MSAFRFLSLSGGEILPYTKQIGEVRIAVFRDFPYLYDGDLEYEEEYLKAYSESENSFVFAVFDNEKLTGVTTALPLAEETEDVILPFIQSEIDINTVCYFGESILLPEYRGQGIGHRFFDEREKFALKSGFTVTAFCSVDRSASHPLKPLHYRSNETFWKKRGYIQQEKMQCQMTWKDIDEEIASPKKLTFWLKEWR